MAHVTSLVVAGALILWLTRREWFFFDEWEFIANRVAPGHLQLLVPHMEHWSTVPILIYRALYGAVGLHSYLPYMVVLVGLHLGAAHLLWRAMRRAHVDPWLCAALPLPLLFLGASPENLLWAFQVTYVGSVVFGLVQALLSDHEGPFGWRDVGGWVAGVLALMSSGIGLTFLSVATLVALIRRGFRGAVITAAVPLAVYIAWFVAVGRRGVPGGELGGDNLLALPRYVWDALTTTAGRSTGLAGAGALLVLGLGIWLVRRAELSRIGALPFAAALGSLVLFALIGSVRLVAGTTIGPRYIYPAVALLLPAAGMALTALVGRSALRRITAVSLIVLSAINGAGLLRASAHQWTDRDMLSEQRLLAAADLMRSGARLIGTTPDPLAAPDVTVSKLRTVIDQGALPSGVSISADARMYSAAQLQIAGGSEVPAADAPAAVVIRGIREVQVTARPGTGCVDILPTGPLPAIVLTYDRLGVTTVSTQTSDTLHVVLTSASGSSQASAERTFPIGPDNALPLDVSWADAKIGLQLPAVGRHTICAASVRSAL